MKSYSVTVSKSARKEFDRLPLQTREKIADILRLLCINPFSEMLQAKKLKGEDGLYRSRVGDYRVVYHVDKSSVKLLVVKIRPQKGSLSAPIKYLLEVN